MTDTPIALDLADLDCSAPNCTSPASRVLGFWSTLPWPLQYVGGQWCLPVCDQHATDPGSQETTAHPIDRFPSVRGSLLDPDPQETP